MFPWLLELLVCPNCRSRLAPRLGGDAIVCSGCEAMYPILDGVPVLVPDPAGWMAAHRDAVLASLAERGRVSRRVLAVVDGFAEAAGAVEPRRFSDDWTTGPGEPPQDETLAAWLEEAAARGPTQVMTKHLPASARVVCEIGCGDGGLARALARTGRRLVLGDLSLRAVLRASAGFGGRAKPDVAGVVMDAEHLPLADRAWDAIVAAHLLDVLEDPVGFLEGVRRALRAGGRVLASVPDPTGLDGWLDRAGLSEIEGVQHVPWLRLHHARHVQIYFSRVVVAVPAVSRRRTHPEPARPSRSRTPRAGRPRARRPILPGPRHTRGRRPPRPRRP